MLPVVKWIVMALVLAFVTRPILGRKNLKYVDGGFGLSFGLGSALSFLLAWLIGSIKFIGFGSVTCFVGLIVTGAAAHFICFKFDREAFDSLFEKKELIRFGIGFAAFAILFVFGALVKCHYTDLYPGTEQYMDFGIMQSIYRQKAVPPEDFWMSGQNLNYYYLGLAGSVYLTRLALLTPDTGYALMLVTMFAACTLMAFEITEALIIHKTENFKAGLVGGIGGSLAAIFAGNGHYLLFGVILDLASKISDSDWAKSYSYWFPDSTVYIGIEKDALDHGKHEFPGYTMILGDLHAHLVNLLWVMPFIAILIDYAYRKDDKDEKSFLKGNMLLLGVLLGIFRGSNFWDFPIYFVIAGAVILFTDLKAKGAHVKTFALVLLKGAIIYCTAYIVTLPFTLQFVKMVNGIGIPVHHSQFYKYVIVWCLAIVSTVWLLVHLFREAEFRVTLMSKDALVLTAMGLCALGLIVVPEFVYVRDIYGESYARFNTMFKLTFQAYVHFGLLAGVLLGLLIASKKYYRAAQVGLLIMILSSYLIRAGKVWLYNHSEEFKSMSAIENSFNSADAGDAFLLDVFNVIENDDRENLVVLEAVGEDYVASNKVSSFMGTPTVMGWPVHEWLWQNTYDPVGARKEEIRTFYEENDLGFNYEFLEKYNVDYVVIGPDEVATYYINENGILPLTEVVFSDRFGYKLLKVLK